MKKHWFVMRAEREEGPFSSSELKQLAGVGEISPETLVRLGSEEAWHHARRIKGLFGDGKTADGSAGEPDRPGKRAGNPSAGTTDSSDASAGDNPLRSGLAAEARIMEPLDDESETYGLSEATTGQDVVEHQPVGTLQAPDGLHSSAGIGRAHDPEQEKRLRQEREKKAELLLKGITLGITAVMLVAITAIVWFLFSPSRSHGRVIEALYAKDIEALLEIMPELAWADLFSPDEFEAMENANQQVRGIRYSTNSSGTTGTFRRGEQPYKSLQFERTKMGARSEHVSEVVFKDVETGGQKYEVNVEFGIQKGANGDRIRYCTLIECRYPTELSHYTPLVESQASPAANQYIPWLMEYRMTERNSSYVKGETVFQISRTPDSQPQLTQP